MRYHDCGVRSCRALERTDGLASATLPSDAPRRRDASLLPVPSHRDKEELPKPSEFLCDAAHHRTPVMTRPTTHVMAGPVPAIHVLLTQAAEERRGCPRQAQA